MQIALITSQLSLKLSFRQLCPLELNNSEIVLLRMCEASVSSIAVNKTQVTAWDIVCPEFMWIINFTVKVGNTDLIRFVNLSQVI
jgi:hypothetical protein